MKILIVTDIHGSSFYAEKAVEIFKNTNAEQLILLGDVYNHGPRNPFPEQYAPLKVAEALNLIADKVVAVKGNCDSEVDEMISDFPFLSNYVLHACRRRIFFTHGHVFNKSHVPPFLKKGDAMFYGHFHVNEVTVVNGVTCVNVASASLPKDGQNTYCILTDDAVTLYNFDGDLLQTVQLDETASK